ncbi:MAG: EAL domain-containing protein [Spirochaetales bacterium]|uniref:EAL domain-containing protein n=1 Tax=Candidatus Thalassospirochaeta sargassi TaxID=3119039 RepID=A0AAJ1ICR3_9SPIO|nr:EAL domain-containing protein [Spirochaetales bacterium]
MLYNASIKTNFNRILIYFVIFTIPALLLFNILLNEFTRLQENSVNERIKFRQKEVVETTEFHIRALFNNIYDDLNLIVNANEFEEYLANPSDYTYNQAQNMFIRVLNSKNQYIQLRYISQEGVEVIRIDRKKDLIVPVEKDELQDKTQRYYYKSLIKLGEYDLYISDFDLNIEHGRLEIPYQPVIRFAIPVFYKNTKNGFLIVNFNGFDILNLLERYEINKSQTINLSLMSKNNLITLNLLKKHNDLINSLLEPISLENTAFSKIYEQSLDNERGEFALDEKQFYFIRIMNTETPEWVFDEESDNWILISDFDSNQIQIENDNFLVVHRNIIRIISSIIIAIIILVVVTLIVLKNDDEQLLLVSSYISEVTQEGVLITDGRKKVIYCNTVFENIFGYSLQEMKGKSPDNFLKGQSEVTFNKIKNETLVWEGNIWDITSDNTYILKYLRIRMVYTRNGRIAYYIGIYSEPKIDYKDINDEFIVDHHMLGSSMNFINPIFKNKFREIEKKAVIAIRFNQFETIRSHISYDEDNALVTTISNTFQHISNAGGIILVPASGIILIVTPIEKNNSLNSLMENIDHSITSIRFRTARNISISYVSGVAVSPDHGVNGSELINNAFIALEALTKMRKSKYLVYDQDIYDLVKRDKIIKDEIESAFLNKEFSVVYQLQQNTQSLENTGVEALVRWTNPKLGFVSPNSFIPIMEESNQIVRLGKYVLSLIIDDFRKIHSKLPEGFRVSINLSSQEFNNSEIISDMIKMIDKSGIPKSLFCFEITETSIVESIDNTNMIIQELHEHNIITAIDDFGTGYSSLSYLKNIKADKIKVDRMFIKEYPLTDDGNILLSITNMIKKIPNKIIVEGVETQDQLQLIRDYDCEEFQGYFSSKPISFSEILSKMEIS